MIQISQNSSSLRQLATLVLPLQAALLRHAQVGAPQDLVPISLHCVAQQHVGAHQLWLKRCLSQAWHVLAASAGHIEAQPIYFLGHDAVVP